jgi:polyphosphate glucokinase
MTTAKAETEVVPQTDQTEGISTQSHILAIDIGGTGLKAALLNGEGEMLSERLRVDTPHPCTPDELAEALVKLVEPLTGFDRVSVGFPGSCVTGRLSLRQI